MVSAIEHGLTEQRHLVPPDRLLAVGVDDGFADFSVSLGGVGEAGRRAGHVVRVVLGGLFFSLRRLRVRVFTYRNALRWKQ